MAAHLFIFYYGVLAGLTPPVAPRAYVGAAIAGADGMKTALTACRINLAGFLVPFMFIYNPPLLGKGTNIMGADGFFLGLYRGGCFS